MSLGSIYHSSLSSICGSYDFSQTAATSAWGDAEDTEDLFRNMLVQFKLVSMEVEKASLGSAVVLKIIFVQAAALFLTLVTWRSGEKGFTIC